MRCKTPWRCFGGCECQNDVNGLSRKLWVTLIVGVIAAVVEMVFVLPIQATLGATPVKVFQSIASGALGKAAFAGGLATAGLGVGIHVLVSVVAAGLFVFAADQWGALIRRPFTSGIFYGAIVYVVMNFVVIPLSAIGFSFPKSADLFALSFSVHLFAFGLPIALVARRMLRHP